MKRFLFPLVILCIFLGAYNVVKTKPLMVDELQHYTSIIEITNGEVSEKIILRDAKFPGYVFMMAGLSELVGDNSIPAIRLFNTIISILCFYVFYQLVKKIDQKNVEIKTLQIVFLPILFIFFFLIYTDVFSLLMILLAFYLLISNRCWLSGIIGIISILVRQNNIIWVAFFASYLFVDKYQWQINKISIQKYFKDAWAYLFSMAAFVIFVIVNHGGAFGTVNNLAQPISIHFGNIYFLLFLFFFLFLPMHLNNFSEIFKKTKNNPIVVLLLAAFFVVYLITYQVDHLWNSPAFDFFLRNRILNYSVSGLQEKIIFFLPIGYAFLSLFVIQLRKKVYYFLYPFTILFLSFSWLIEQRYYLVPLTFFILFRKQSTTKIEYLTLLIFILCSALLFFGVANGYFFL